MNLNLFNIKMMSDLHLLRIDITLILSGILLILGHIQLKDIIKKRLAKDMEINTRTKIRANLLKVVKACSYVSCFYMFIKGYGIITMKYYNLSDYVNLYRNATDLFICVLLYLTVIRVHKFLIDHTARPKLKLSYDIIMLVIYSTVSIYIINVNIY
jgi:hypothetical protein